MKRMASSDQRGAVVVKSSARDVLIWPHQDELQCNSLAFLCCSWENDVGMPAF